MVPGSTMRYHVANLSTLSKCGTPPPAPRPPGPQVPLKLRRNSHALQKYSNSNYLAGPNVIKFFIAVIYNCSLSARAFFRGKPFQLILLFVSKARGYSSEGVPK
jgi:hypothetical protein